MRTFVLFAGSVVRTYALPDQQRAAHDRPRATAGRQRRAGPSSPRRRLGPPLRYPPTWPTVVGADSRRRRSIGTAGTCVPRCGGSVCRSRTPPGTTCLPCCDPRQRHRARLVAHVSPRGCRTGRRLSLADRATAGRLAVVGVADSAPRPLAPTAAPAPAPPITAGLSRLSLTARSRPRPLGSCAPLRAPRGLARCPHPSRARRTPEPPARVRSGAYGRGLPQSHVRGPFGPALLEGLVVARTDRSRGSTSHPLTTR